MFTEMFWVAEYNNGLAYPEYDEHTGQVNKFAQVDHKNVLRFWWLPVTKKMAEQFPNLRVNPLLKKHGVDLNGSKGYVTRRIAIRMGRGQPVQQQVKCYILGIEGGPRREIYPDGKVINIEVPKRGETQDILHHG
jgi:hypothetical protein